MTSFGLWDVMYRVSFSVKTQTTMLASVAQLDARLTGDQEVAGWTPTRLAAFFRGDWSWNIFYGHSLPSTDSRRAVVSFWQKNAHNTG